MTTISTIKLGIIGSGYIAKGLILALENIDDIQVTRILTRRNLSNLPNSEQCTNSIDELIDHSQIIVECTGDTIFSTDMVARVLEASLPVVTMNAELHVTSGTYLAKRGLITEAEGDQPGALAALHREIVAMGFKPLVYGNLKGFLNHTPTPDDMRYWADVYGISLNQVTGFTDGTKLQFEQVLVANGLGASIATQGMFGFVTEDPEKGAEKLAAQAKALGSPISDYLLCSPQAKKKFPAGIFITAEHDPRQSSYLKYLKLGDGPFYTLFRNYHLCHLEIPKTIREVARGNGVLLNNSSKPTASVATISKMPLLPGMRIERVKGNFQVRGEAITIQSAPDHLPFGLIHNAVIRRKIEPNQMLTFADVEIPDSLALHAWEYTLNCSQTQPDPFLPDNQHRFSNRD